MIFEQVLSILIANTIWKINHPTTEMQNDLMRHSTVNSVFFSSAFIIIKGVQYQISLTSWLKRMQRPHKLRFTCKNVSAPELNVNAQLTDKQILAQANKVLGDQALPMPNNMSLCMTPICFNNMTSLRLKISAWWYTKGCIQLKVLNDAQIWMQIQLYLSHIFYSDKSFILPHQ